MKDQKPTPTTTVPLSESAVADLLKAGKALAPAQILDGLAPFAVVPDGFRVEYLERKKFADVPDHIRQDVRLDDADSFISYVKQFRTHTARIFASAPNLASIAHGSSGGAEFTAVLDYHEGGKDQKAQRAKHVATYPVPLSLEFRTWLAGNGKPKKQMEFVEFIEANCADVVTPSSAEIMELALNFGAKSNVEFQSKVDRVSGGRDLKFVERVDGGGGVAGNMKVPEYLTLRLAIFDGGKPYELRARLEYRANSSGLTITYHLQRPHEVFRTAHLDLKGEISSALDLEILTGAPAPIDDDLE
jgi:uncharacterized protein YfdQ (DUF2303 family)